jgi:hypothetical protein
MSDNIANDRFVDRGVQPIDPANLDVLNELIQREPIFHRPELGTTRQDFENMTVETFWEVGASRSAIQSQICHGYARTAALGTT